MKDTYSEEWRRECEARWVLDNLPVINPPRTRKRKTTRQEYINGVEDQRGKAAADQLKRDIRGQWELRRKQA